MTSHGARVCAVLLAGAAVLAGAQFAAAESQTPPSYYYSYFDEPIPLELDTGFIAVFEADSTSPAPLASVADRLTRFGIAAEEVQPYGLDGTYVARTPDEARSEAGVQRLVADLAASGNFAFVSPYFLDTAGDPLMITEHLHIGFEETVTPEQAEAILATTVPGTILDRDWADMKGVYRIRCDLRDGFKVLELLNSLATMPEVKFAESDKLMSVRPHYYFPNDPFFSYLWGLHQPTNKDMDAPQAWDISKGDESIVVVILDDGVEQDHPDITQIPGWDFTGSGSGGDPVAGCDDHGTTVAGNASATIDNELGIVGISPLCPVFAAKVYTNNCTGMTFYPSSYVSALNYSNGHGYRITNTSSAFGPDSSITTKLAETQKAGMVHFSSSGNEGVATIGYPASLPTVIAVGALNQGGGKATFSCWGDELGLCAPGEDILLTDRTGGDGYGAGDYDWGQGTSYASPYAAGVAALILSVDSTLNAFETQTLLENTCREMGAPGWDIYFGWGFVNAFNAVRLDAEEPPFTDEFADTELDRYTWLYIQDAKVDDDGINPPSPPYALNLDGQSTTGGDEIRSGYIDTSDLDAASLEYWYQRGGGGNPPEVGEDLVVEYFASSMEWVELDRQLGGEPPMYDGFEHVAINLPADALHAAFRIKFRSISSSSGTDDWFVDDVAVTEGPIGAEILAARSCVTHSDAGEFCLDLGSGGDTPGDNVEPRLAGISTLEFDVSGTVSAFAVDVSCDAGSYGGTITPVADGSDLVTVNFDPALPSNDCCTLSFSGGVLGDFAVATLQADVDRNLNVNSVDYSAVKPRFGQSTDGSNFRYDLNGDGMITSLDASAIKPRFGTVLPGCP